MLYVLVLLVLGLWAILILFVISSSFYGFLRTSVPFVPTPTADIEFVVKALPITTRDVIYDLGSGDGKVILLMERHSGAQGVGFELTRWTHLLARLKAGLKKSKVKFFCRNFFREDWSGATVIYGYLYPPLMHRVEEKFLADCKPGTRCVIRDFPLPNLKPATVYHRPHGHEIYVYIKS